MATKRYKKTYKGRSPGATETTGGLYGVGETETGQPYLSEEAKQRERDAAAAANGGSSSGAGSAGSGGSSGSSGIPSGMTPGQIGEYGFFPADLTSKFPKTGNKIKVNPIDYTPTDIALQEDPTSLTYDPLKAANFDFTDPQAFAATYGEFNRKEILKNFDQSKDMALEQLDLELQGLQQFVPAAAALKRNQTSLDNQFNQAQREAQVNSALPNARGDLAGQRSRALAYAEGRAPDSVIDNALTISGRARATDQASAGGFGASSSAARKLSDLTAAEDRIKLSEYGDRLLSGNIDQESNLFLAPTQYSDAGAQVQVNPRTSAADRASQIMSEINSNTLINPTNALSTTVQQKQFQTNLDQRTGEFNTSNTIRTNEYNTTNKVNQSRFNAETTNQGNQFNTSNRTEIDKFNETNRIDIRKFKINNANEFRMAKFNYQVSLAGAIAGAAQTNANTQVAIAQQEAYNQIFQDSLTAKQESDQAGVSSEGIAAAGAALITTISSFLGDITKLFGSLGDKAEDAESTIDNLPTVNTEFPEFGTNAESDIDPNFSIDPADQPGYDSGSGGYTSGLEDEIANLGRTIEDRLVGYFEKLDLTD